MLLRMPVPPESRDAANSVREGVISFAEGELAVATVAVANGGVCKPPSFLSEPNPLVELKLYIHPGRSELGRMSRDQAVCQLDWRHASFHRSLGQAELAAENRMGFLVEVVGVFEDGQGRSRRGGAFFLPLEPQVATTKG